MKTSIFLAVLGAGAVTVAHMKMDNPAPLRHQLNPNNGGDVDYDLTSPILLGDFPCHGDLGLLGTEKAAPVADYVAGQSYSATISGGATHNGGSCQFSLSYDDGETWTVIQSIIGGCPLSDGDTFDFTIPSDAPSSDAALFSWSWINKTGNREFYQNCAVVTIADGSGGKSSVPFAERPQIFIANIIDGCTVAEGTDVLFPDPGPDVLVNSPDAAPPQGDNCGSTGAPAPDAPAPGPGDGNGGDDGKPPPPATTWTSAAAKPSVPVPTPSEEPSVSLPGGVFKPVTTTTSTGSAPATLVTSVVPPAETSAAAPAPAPTSSAAPAPAPAPDNGADAGVLTGPCSAEGDWNCIEGTKFQRCASGRWSVSMDMAPGTSCQAGVSDTLIMSKRNLRFRRDGN